MKSVEVSGGNVTLGQLLPLVAAGEEIILTESSKPVARMTAIGTSEGRRSPGLHRGAFEAAADFDVALPENFWLGKP